MTKPFKPCERCGTPIRDLARGRYCKPCAADVTDERRSARKKAQRQRNRNAAVPPLPDYAHGKDRSQHAGASQ